MYQPIKSIDAHVHLTSILFAQDIFQPKENVLDGDCVKACLSRMEKHGIDQCLAIAAQGISMLPLENHMLIKMAELLPEKIAGAMVGFSTPREDPGSYDPDAAAEEIAGYMKNPVVKGLGEFALEGVGGMRDWPEVWAKLRPTFEVLAKHNAPALFHTGASPHFAMPSEKRAISGRALYFANPALLDDVAEEFPEVPIIIGHAGVQGFYFYGSYPDMALTVAARHKNVYIETSSVPYDVLLKAADCPAIGPEKLIFGTDSPAFYGYYKSGVTGEFYPSYGDGIPGDIMTDHYPVDIENINRLPITDRERQMIMGGTIAKLIGAKHE